MPYSHLLMTLIFIKRLCGGAGAGGDLCVPPASACSSTGAVMRTELRRLDVCVDANAMQELTGSVVSTRNLCNANFGRG
jgi:hypothetical protein